MPVLIICKFDDTIITEVAIVWTFFPLYVYETLDLVVAMEAEVLTRSAQKPNTVNSPPQWWYLWNFIKIGREALAIFLSESVDARTHEW